MEAVHSGHAIHPKVKMLPPIPKRLKYSVCIPEFVRYWLNETDGGPAMIVKMFIHENDGSLYKTTHFIVAPYAHTFAHQTVDIIRTYIHTNSRYPTHILSHYPAVKY